ncbi:MAG: DUF6465 family protein [Clostridiales bacterium]|jgi:hypothetical protein|nr:DUF6465 family protein [Clostridiales bacterium]
MKTDIYIEVGGKKVNSKTLVETTKEKWKAEGNKVKDLQAVEIYFKPEEGMCYYVLNSGVEGSFEV